MKYIENAIKAFLDLPEKANKETIPCTEAEIEALAKMLPKGYYLPEAFVEFLRYAGHKMGELFRSVDFSYQMVKIHLEDHHKDILKMLKISDPAAELPEDIFIISEYLGSSFTYILLSEGPNPPVYWWEEGGGGLEEAEVEAKSFNDFLELRIAEERKMIH